MVAPPEVRALSADDLARIVGGLGLGAGAGAVLTALINTRSNRGKSRAEAADLLVGAAERVGRINAELDAELRALRANLDALKSLTMDFLDKRITQEEFIHRASKIYNREDDPGKTL